MSGRGGKAPRGRAGFNSKSGGISLDRFARAKKSTYDPREVKEKERARAAITVAKYKKLKKRLQRASDIPTSNQPPQQQGLRDAKVDSDHTDGDGAPAIREEPPSLAGTSREAESANKRSKHNYDEKRRKEDLDAEEEAAKAAAAAQRAAAKQRRRDEHKLFKKKTHHGQPLMKHRIEKMLHQLEKNY